MSTAAPKPHVLIVGAGIGGLSVAQGLKKAGIPFTIFERDPSKDFRPQGYRIRVDPDASLAIKELLSDDQWKDFETTCPETRLGGTQIDALTGELVVREGGPAGIKKKMEMDNRHSLVHTVDRTVFRLFMMLGLEEELKFGKEFTKYEITGEGAVVVHFSDGTTAKGDVLVGADGTRSPVRRQYLPNVLPIVDTAGRCIYGKTPLAPELLEKYPEAALKFVTLFQDRTPLTLFTDPVRFVGTPESRSLGAKLPTPPDYIYWVLLWNHVHSTLPDPQFLRLTAGETYDLTLKLTEAWNPSIRSLLELQDRNMCSPLRVYSTVPDIPVWEPSRVTLLGDAVHLMSPTGGAGLNTALRDAAGLCRAIIAAAGGETSLEVEIGKYEAEMRRIAKVGLLESEHGAKKMLNGAPLTECKPVEDSW